MKKYYVLFVFIAVLMSCSKPDVSHENETFMRSYIPKYYSADGIKVNVSLDESSNFLLIITAIDINGAYSYNSDGIAKVKYDAICTKNNDTTYKKYIADSLLTLWGDVGFFDTNFTSVSVTADQDYDATHSAGTLLNDRIYCNYFSPFGFVCDGYTSTSTTLDSMTDRYFPAIGWVWDIVLSQLNYEQFKALGDGSTYELMRLTLYNNGQLSNGTKLTVTLMADDGRVFSDTVQVSWE